MHTDERWDDEPEEPSGEPPDFAWATPTQLGRGELQNLAAFVPG